MIEHPNRLEKTRMVMNPKYKTVAVSLATAQRLREAAYLRRMSQIRIVAAAVEAYLSPRPEVAPAPAPVAA